MSYIPLIFPSWVWSPSPTVFFEPAPKVATLPDGFTSTAISLHM